MSAVRIFLALFVSLTFGVACGALLTLATHGDEVTRAVSHRAVVAGIVMVPPVDQVRVTSSYGWRRGKFHAGVDLRAREGAPLYAVAPGVVTQAVKRDTGVGGKRVVLALDSGWRAGYAHMSRVDVERRERVVAGTQVGLAGSTGRASGPHLHFELRAPNGALVDPMPYVAAATVRTARAAVGAARSEARALVAAVTRAAQHARDRRA